MPTAATNWLDRNEQRLCHAPEWCCIGSLSPCLAQTASPEEVIQSLHGHLHYWRRPFMSPLSKLLGGLFLLNSFLTHRSKFFFVLTVYVVSRTACLLEKCSSMRLQQHQATICSLDPVVASLAAPSSSPSLRFFFFFLLCLPLYWSRIKTCIVFFFFSSSSSSIRDGGD